MAKLRRKFVREERVPLEGLRDPTPYTPPLLRSGTTELVKMGGAVECGKWRIGKLSGRQILCRCRRKPEEGRNVGRQ